MGDRLDIIYLSRLLGTASGWDGDPGEYLMYYNFVPKIGVPLEEGLLQINEANGWIYVTDDAERDGTKYDLVTFLACLPRIAKSPV